MEKAYQLLISSAPKTHTLFLLSPLARASHMAPTYLQGMLGNVEEVMGSLVSTNCVCYSALVLWGLDEILYIIVSDELGHTTKADPGEVLVWMMTWWRLFSFSPEISKETEKRDTREIDQGYRAVHVECCTPVPPPALFLKEVGFRFSSLSSSRGGGIFQVRGTENRSLLPFPYFRSGWIVVAWGVMGRSQHVRVHPSSVKSSLAESELLIYSNLLLIYSLLHLWGCINKNFLSSYFLSMVELYWAP